MMSIKLLADMMTRRTLLLGECDKLKEKYLELKHPTEEFVNEMQENKWLMLSDAEEFGAVMVYQKEDCVITAIGRYAPDHGYRLKHLLVGFIND